MSIYLQRATKQTSVQADVDVRGPLHREGGGYLYNLGGEVYYSPRTKRPSLSKPSVSPGTGGGVIQGRDYNLKPFLEPQWWTKAHGYLAFVPLKPGHNQLPVNPLQNQPKVHFDRQKGTAFPDERQWARWRDYQTNVYTACHLLLFASGAAAVRPALPCARIDNGPGRRTRNQLRTEISEAAQWFEIWHGCLSYSIAVSEAIEAISKRTPGCRDIPGWMETLLEPRKLYQEKVEAMRKRNEMREAWQWADTWSSEDAAPESQHSIPTTDVLDEAFAASLLHSCISAFDGSVERVGVFARIPASQAEVMVSIDWLCEFNVPVFYAWGQREMELAEREPHWARYAPPPDAEWVITPSSIPSPSHGLLQVFPVEPLPSPAELNTATTLGAATRRNYVVRHEPPPNQWIEFFQQIEKTAPQEWQNLSEKQRRLRRAWERNPPRDIRKTSYVIWKWLEEEDRFITRAPTEDDLEDLRSNVYGKKQRRYFAVRNVWHVCEFMGPPDMERIYELASEDVDEGDEDYDRKYDEAVRWWKVYYRLEPIPSDISSMKQTSLPSMEQDYEGTPFQLAAEDGVDTLMASQNKSSSSGVVEVEEWGELGEVGKWMAEALGFTFPLGKHRQIQAAEPILFKGIAKYIYTLRTSINPINKAYWSTEEGNLATQLLWGYYASDQAIPRHLCDLYRENHSPIAATTRFKGLRRETQSVRVQRSLWDNVSGYLFGVVEGPAVCYWLDEEDKDGWYIGATTAAAMLHILRLPSSAPTPYNLALLMALRGAPFRTWYKISGLDETRVVPAQSPHLILYRSSPESTFGQRDYEHYQLHLRNMLNSNSRERAAIRRGGIIWRLAIDAGIEPRRSLGAQVSCVALAGQGIVRRVNQVEFFVDDALDADEEGAMVGSYTSVLKTTSQLGRVSWWPPADMWDEHFGVLGWSDAAEHFFTARKQKIYEEFKPLAREEWRKVLRIGEKKASRFWSSVERLADEACIGKGL